MTLIEAIFVFTCGLAFTRWPVSTPVILAAVIAAAAASVYLEGVRAPLVPAYSVGVALLVAALLPTDRLPQALQWLGLAGGLLLLCASIAACIVLPLRRFPPTAGPYSVGTRAVPPDLIERFAPKSPTAPARPAPQARLWYPTASRPQSWIGQELLLRNREPGVEGAALASTPDRFPVVLYFAGWPGTQIQNFVLIRELVSRGFVVVSLIYPGKLPSMSDAQFAQQLAVYNAPWDYSTEAGAQRMGRFFDSQVRHGAEDATAMLNLLDAVNEQDLLAPFRGRLALDHAGVLGFSMGGGTSAQAGWLEPRFKAVVNMDGWHWHESLQQGVPHPYLYLSEPLVMPTPDQLASPNLDTRYTAERHRIEFVNVPRLLEQRGGTQVTLAGMSHSNFTDMNLYSPLRRLNQGGSIDRFRALELVNAYVCSFLTRELQGRPAPLLEGDSSLFPEAKVKVWPVPPVAAAAANGNSATPR